MSDGIEGAARELARELRDWREEVRADFREVKATQANEFQQIKDKQDLTNGRVRAIELWKARVEGFTAGFKWAPALALSVASGGTVAVISTVLH